MRIRFVLALAVSMMFAAPALAGTLTVENGQIAWKSTKCTPPKVPPGLSGNPETAADDMNTRALEYEEYTRFSNIYVKCLSSEAEKDAAATGQAIIASVQQAIDEEQKRAKALGQGLAPYTAGQ